MKIQSIVVLFLVFSFGSFSFAGLMSSGGFKTDEYLCYGIHESSYLIRMNSITESMATVRVEVETGGAVTQWKALKLESKQGVEYVFSEGGDGFKMIITDRVLTNSLGKDFYFAHFQAVIHGQKLQANRQCFITNDL